MSGIVAGKISADGRSGVFGTVDIPNRPLWGKQVLLFQPEEDCWAAPPHIDFIAPEDAVLDVVRTMLGGRFYYSALPDVRLSVGEKFTVLHLKLPLETE